MPTLLYNPEAFPEQTYDDVCLVPRNAVVKRLQSCATASELETLRRLHRDWREASDISANTMREYGTRTGEPVHAAQKKARSARRSFLDHVLTLTARYPDVARMLSRDEVDFTPVDGWGNTPIVVANMNQVVGKRMEEVADYMGATAALPQDKTNREMQEIIADVHSAHPRYLTPVTVHETTKVHQFRTYLEKRDLPAAIVLNARDQLIGVLGNSNIPEGVNNDVEIGQYVRREDVTTAEEGIGPMEALRLMRQKNINLLPILKRNTKSKVVGAWTPKYAAYALRYKPNLNEAGRPSVTATIGALNKRPVDRARKLIDMGVDALVMDTAHFDQGVLTYANLLEVNRLIERVRSVTVQRTRRRIFLVAGNVVTAEATADIIAAGADVAKVGIGPGAMCETRMISGVGRPQFTAVLQCAQAAAEEGGHVWADGGIRYPRDVALALAAGASQVMIGSLFTPTWESPPPFKYDGDRKFKTNSGMASRASSALRNHRVDDTLEEDIRRVFREYVGHRSEGLDEGRVFQVKGRESASDVIHDIMDGVTSAMTYMDARNLEEFYWNAQIAVQTRSGFEEGKPKEKM